MLVNRSAVLLISAALAAVPVAAAGAAEPDAASPAGTVRQDGAVRSGGSAVARAEVVLYRAGQERGAPATVLGRARSDAGGRFTISYQQPRERNAVLYLLADAGGRHKPVRLATVLDGPRRTPPRVVVNERTTVAAAYAMAQFTDGRDIAGTYPGLQNAAATAQNLADVTTGKIAAVLAAPPNGSETSTLRAFNSLANTLAGCVAGKTCEELFRLARPAGGDRPSNTFRAALDIAHNPGRHVGGLYRLSLRERLYTPALTAAPDAWTLAVRYDADGRTIDGPGNIAFDAHGNAWVPNNYIYNPDPREPTCGGDYVIKLTPTGENAPGSPYRGGGLYGAGYGITLDPKGNVWVGNFGFQGTGCPLDPDPLYRSVSQFRPDGTPLSPPTGWRYGDIMQPQGTVSDRRGNIWIANCGNRSVTRVPHGRPDHARNIASPSGGLIKPFSVAIDTRGRASVTGNGSDNVLRLSPKGAPLGYVSGGGISAPMGNASDSVGNVWVANSGLVDIPCDGTGVLPPESGALDQRDGAAEASVTMIRPDGTTPRHPYERGGLFLPWGIAVDGDDNVWVSNFGGQRVAHLCGARPKTCPSGHRTGDPISPASTGYTSDGLVRNTAVQIDPSGNVWLTNNWETVPLQTNPGGHEVVVFVGMAAPVRTPLLGTPGS
ncbi:Vgb family protein [Streptomyces sp. SYSU K21746]